MLSMRPPPQAPSLASSNEPHEGFRAGCRKAGEPDVLVLEAHRMITVPESAVSPAASAAATKPAPSPEERRAKGRERQPAPMAEEQNAKTEERTPPRVSR